MTACVITIPADRIVWGPVQRVGDFCCMQTAKLYQGEDSICSITVQWPEVEPSVAIVSTVDGRHAGAHD